MSHQAADEYLSEGDGIDLSLTWGTVIYFHVVRFKESCILYSSIGYLGFILCFFFFLNLQCLFMDPLRLNDDDQGQSFCDQACRKSVGKSKSAEMKATVTATLVLWFWLLD